MSISARAQPSAALNRGHCDLAVHGHDVVAYANDAAARRTWEQDIAGNIAKGAANWPRVLKK